MPKNEDPDWELVDSLPGEKSKRETPPPRKPSNRRAMWIGFGIGALAVAALPPLRMAAGALAQGLVRSWWILVGLAIYFVWRRTQKRKRR